jgi:thiamine monophosphate synthase
VTVTGPRVRPPSTAGVAALAGVSHQTVSRVACRGVAGIVTTLLPG